MAIINSETFDILEGYLIEHGSQEHFFDCDEELAGIISILNKKGYRTLFCCSGHLYDDINDTFVLDDTSMTEDDIRESFPGVLKIDDLPDGNRRLTLRQNLALKTYIMFDREIRLPSVPENWRFERHTLSHNYYWDEAFEDVESLDWLKAHPFRFYRRRLELLSALFDWVETIPDFRDLPPETESPAPEELLYRPGRRSSRLE